MLVLSLFPGIGLLDLAFELEGFCVVRGPDLLWGGDIRRFHPPAGRFDGIIGGPPCQLFSAFRHINPKVGRHGNQIPEFERVAGEAQPAWFVMENVTDAPLPSVSGYLVESLLLRDVWVGGETSRLRRFSLGTRDGRSLSVDTFALHASDGLPAVCSDARIQPVAIGGSGKRKKKPGVSRVTSGNGPRLPLSEMLRRQGAPADLFTDSPFTEDGKRKMLGSGVPLAMGRAVAGAVKRALGIELKHTA